MENKNSIEKFDPSTLMQGVKDRIKATFVSLIPDAQWEQMVQHEIDNYFNIKKDSDRNYNNTRTGFQTMVNDTINNECKERIKKYLSSPDFDCVWGSNGIPIVTEQIKKLLIDNSGEILANMMGGIFQQMLREFRNQIKY